MTDPWLRAALDAGGHLGDDVARALLEDEKREEIRILNPDGSDHKFEAELCRILREDHPELD
jgi:hypothetical protein